MPDREKVMRGLQKVANICALNGDIQSMRTIDDALALLKEQEPKVLEYSEIDKHPLVWLEDNDKEDVIPALFLQYNGWSAEFSRQAQDKYVDTIVRSAKVIADERMYGITWRAWTSRPTPEQMRETKWGEEKAE